MEPAGEERVDHDSIQLTEREMAIAKKAASIAVQEVANEFYRQVGQSVVKKLFVWVGMAAIGFAAAKGYIKWGG